MTAENALEVGSIVSGVFLVTDAQLLTDRRGRKYYSLKLNMEGGREVAAKVWSDNIDEAIERGQGIESAARVEQYREEIQLNVQRYSVLLPGSFDPAPYVKTSDIDVDAAFTTLFGSPDTFSDPLIAELIAAFYGHEGFALKFKAAPAAGSRHHNYRGGLIEHTLQVFELAGALAPIYAGKIDRGLLLAGAAVHDVGKVHCYRLVSGVSEHTEEGMLIDHIFIGASMVSNLWDSQVAPSHPERDAKSVSRRKSLLLHMLLSHHGKKEWGAPVLPKTPEAMLLHFCDQISATMQDCLDLLDSLAEGEEWTQWLTVMDEGRKLFRHRDWSE